MTSDPTDLVIAGLIVTPLVLILWACLVAGDESKHPTPRPPDAADLLAEREAEHESLSARPDRVTAAEALIDRIFPDPSVPKGER